MAGVFIYWDNSNIFHEAQRIAEEKDATPGARYLVRIHFDNLLQLAHADRPLTKAVAAGSVPPEMQQLWNRMENSGVEVNLFDRGARDRGEQGTPDQWLQLRMLEDGWDNNGDPGIVALLTGDGAGYVEGRGFHSTPAADASTWLAGRSAVVDSFVQPGNARMGESQRRICTAGRLLHFDNIPRTVSPRSRIRGGEGSGLN